MNWLFFCLIFLISCSTVQHAESPNVTTTPVSLITPSFHNLEPEAKPLQDISVSIIQPVIVKPQLTNSSGEIPCMDDCENRCAERAQQACTQKERAACRAECGDIIENSACVQACTYLTRPEICKQQFEQFCNAQCVKECY